MMKNNHPQTRQHDIVIQELENEVLIYDLSKNKAFCLNQTSSIVWLECDGKKSVAEISQTLRKKLKLNFSEDLVWLALNQFKKDDLLEDNDDFITPFDGLNRREIVKRIGFASLVALPIIVSVIAPSAVHAQSGNCTAPPSVVCFPVGNGAGLSQPGCRCQGNTDCVEGICQITGLGFNTCAVINAIVNPFCAPGNGLNLSSPCCSCLGNSDCESNICSVAANDTCVQ
jgi:hypothetical protein